MKYLIWSFEHDAWWAPDRRGYTEDIEKAGRYSKDEAGEIVTDSVWCEEMAILEEVAKTNGPPFFAPWGGSRFEPSNMAKANQVLDELTRESEKLGLYQPPPQFITQSREMRDE